MKPGDIAYFIVSGRRIEKGIIKKMNGDGILVITTGGGLRLSRRRFYASEVEAKKHLLPSIPHPTQIADPLYTQKKHEIAWRPSISNSGKDSR